MGLGEVEESGNEGAKMAKTMQVGSDASDGSGARRLGWGFRVPVLYNCMGVFGVTKIFRKVCHIFDFGG